MLESPSGVKEENQRTWLMAGPLGRTNEVQTASAALQFLFNDELQLICVIRAISITQKVTIKQINNNTL